MLWMKSPRDGISLVHCSFKDGACRTEPLAGRESYTWLVRRVGDHVVELGYDGSVSIDGSIAFRPEVKPSPGIPVLLTSPAQREVVYLDRASG